MIEISAIGSAASSLAKIWQFSQEMKEGRQACEQLYERLAAIQGELEKMETEKRLPDSTALGKYVGVVNKSQELLEQHRKNGPIKRIIKHGDLITDMRRIHEDVDALFQILNLTNTNAMVVWQEQWRTDRRDQNEQLREITLNGEELLRELRDLPAQMEALMSLKYEIKKKEKIHRRTKQDNVSIWLLKRAHDTIVSGSGTVVEDLPAWFLPASDIQYDPIPFDYGSFGTVHNGVWSSNVQTGGARVVVKVIPCGGGNLSLAGSSMVGNLTTKEMKAVMKEMDTWYKFTHPNIIQMYGASHVSSPPFIVCEEAAHGNMRKFLDKSPINKAHFWRLMCDVATGLDYIHNTAGIVHGDLKLNNILVGADGRAKVADFGLSIVRVLSSAYTSSVKSEAQKAGALRWRAPECMHHSAKVESDVYSLAMCFIEGISERVPFADLSDDAVRGKLERGEIPERPENMDDEVWELVVSMTFKDPKKRLSLTHVMEKLKKFADAEGSNDGQIISMNFGTTVLCGSCNKVVSKGSFCSACGNDLKSNQREAMLLGTDENDPFNQMTEPEPSDSIDIHTSKDIGALVALVRSGNDKQKENAAGALGNLSRSAENKVKIAEAGGIPPLVVLVRSGNDIQKENAAGALWGLSRSSENKVKIAEAGGIPPLVALVRAGNDSQKENAARALWGLAVNNENKVKIKDAGGISALKTAKRSSNEIVRTKAQEILTILKPSFWEKLIG